MVFAQCENLVKRGHIDVKQLLDDVLLRFLVSNRQLSGRDCKSQILPLNACGMVFNLEFQPSLRVVSVSVEFCDIEGNIVSLLSDSFQ